MHFSPRPLLVVALALLPAASARAEPAAGGSPLAYRLPPAPLPPPEQAPGREPDDIPRRQIELVAAASVLVPRCAAPAPSEATALDPCAHLAAGPALGLALLFRPVPHLALGGAASRASFGWDADRGIGRGAGSPAASFTAVTALGRGYLKETGVMDAYVGASVGVGFLSLSAERGGVVETLRRESLVLGSSLGLEFWLSSHLRAGPEIELSWQPSQAIERCTGDVCLDASSVVARSPSHAFRLGATITLAVGDEL